MHDSSKGNENVKDAYLIHDEALELSQIEELLNTHNISTLSWEHRNDAPGNIRVLLYLEDDMIRELIPMSIDKAWDVCVLDHTAARQAARACGVKGSMEKLIDHYMQAKASDADVLTCNDQVVFSSVVIGEVLTLNPYDANNPPTRIGIMSHALRAIRNLRLRNFNITTGKEQTIKSAALGIVVMDNTQSSLIGQGFSDAISISDGRLTMLTFSPRSILGYMWSLVRLLLPIKINLSRLPDSIGLISSQSVELNAADGIEYKLDGIPMRAETIDFKILEQGIRLVPGPAFTRVDTGRQKSAKDKIRLSHIPVDETAQRLSGEPLPLFSSAGEEEYRDLFVSLRESSVLSSSYLVLMVLSTLLAVTGLYANSAPVIIGAMILAPLMSPIISFAMGLVRTEPNLIRNSLRTVLIGIGTGLFCAITVSWLLPIESLTTEMQVRLSPTLLDLSVAVISGIAGAYAFAREEIARSLAGVAVAVALVPPLSVSGIAVGWADWDMARGAFLLLITNLVGISLAASVTFLVMGFAPFTLARKGLAISLLMLVLIIVPLSISFASLVEQARIVNRIPTGQIELAGQKVYLRNVKVRAGEPPLVRLVLSSSKRIDEDDVDELKQIISTRVGHDVELEAQLNLLR